MHTWHSEYNALCYGRWSVDGVIRYESQTLHYYCLQILKKWDWWHIPLPTATNKLFD